MTASTNFDALTYSLATAKINFASNNNLNFLLVTTAPTLANMYAWTYRSDVTNECASSNAAGGGYSNGTGGTITTATTLDTVNHCTNIVMGSPTSFTNSTLSAVGAIIYKSVGSAATDLLISYVDFGGTVSSSNGTFSVTFSTPLKISL